MGDTLLLGLTNTLTQKAFHEKIPDRLIHAIHRNMMQQLFNEKQENDWIGIIDDGNVTVVGPNDFYVQENLSAEVIDGFSSLESNYATEEEYGALGLNSDYEMSDVNELSGTNYEPINWEDFSEVSQESEYLSELNETNFDNYSSSEAFLVSDSDIAEDIL